MILEQTDKEDSYEYGYVTEKLLLKFVFKRSIPI